LLEVVEDLKARNGERRVKRRDDDERLLVALVVEGRERLGEKAGEGKVVLRAEKG
jgi:hypothetical protein